MAQAYGYLRMTEDTRTKFLRYFDDGMSASEAKEFHEMMLLAAPEADVSVGAVIANAQINPTNRQITHLYTQWRQQNYGGRTYQSVLAKLKEKQDTYADCGVEVKIDKDPFTVVIVTPIMRRIHQQYVSEEIIFVDSSGSCDQMSTCVTFIFCASKIGALPLACVLHESQSMECYTAVFDRIRNVLRSLGFNGAGYPALIMTHDSAAERGALAKVFPSSRLLLCSFHILQALWRWLCQTDHNIMKEDRPHLMKMFRSILFERDETACKERFNQLVADENCRKYLNYIDHVQQYWNRNTDLAYYHRQNLPTHGHNTNNIVESSIRIFKEIVLQRCKSYNACALVDFVAKVFENYHKLKLLKFANSRVTTQDLIYRKLVDSASDLNVTKLNKYEYNVSSSSDCMLLYSVDTEFGSCDCPQGNGGKFCKHLCDVNLQLESALVSSPLITSKERATFAKIALGKTVDESFYQDMMDVDSCELELSTPTQLPFKDPVPHVVQNIIEDATSQLVPPEFLLEVCKLKENFSRLSELTSSYYPGLEISLKKLNSQLSRCDTVPQFLSTFVYSSRVRNISQRRISVQPTSIARRKKRVGLKCGTKSIQAGRPTSFEGAKSVKLKRKRNLGLNIKLNQMNAKSHGPGH